MNPKQQAFAREFIVDHNATQAAIRAGYSARTASTKGEQLLRIVEVRGLVAKLDAETAKRCQIESAQVMRELARVGLSSITHVMSWDDEGSRLIPSAELTADAAGAIMEVTDEETTSYGEDGSRVVRRRRKIKMHPKTPALSKMAEVLAMVGRLASIDKGGAALPGVIMIPTGVSQEEWEAEHGVVEVDKHGTIVH